MSLLGEIQNAAVDGSSDLESLLRKCRILATKLKHDELKNWVMCELDGYPPDVPLPDYRKLHGMCFGHFFGAFGRGVKNCPIPETAIPEELREVMSHKHFREGVSALKNLLDSADGPVLQFGWPAEASGIIRPKNMAPDMVLAQGWVNVDRGSVSGILSTVRNRILSFALEIEASYPDAGEATPGETPVPKEVVTQIFNQTFHGPVANVASGHDIAQSGTINIQQGDFRTLAAYMKENGVGDDDIKELEAAVKADPHPSGKKFGKKVSAWMGKMVQKTGANRSGAEQTASGGAGVYEATRRRERRSRRIAEGQGDFNQSSPPAETGDRHPAD